VGAVWLRARAQLRGRLLASLLLALLVGLAGGVVLAAVTGARRSDAALPRFLAASHTTDVTVWFTGPRGGQPSRTDLATELGAVAALPQVRSARRVVSLIMSGSDPLGPTSPSRQLGWVGLDGTGLRCSAVRWWWPGDCRIPIAPTRQRSTKSSPGATTCASARPSGSGPTRGPSSVRPGRGRPSGRRARRWLSE
jgi:hypothetical protein